MLLQWPERVKLMKKAVRIHNVNIKKEMHYELREMKWKRTKEYRAEEKKTNKKKNRVSISSSCQKVK